MRVMREATVEATANKLFDACGASWLGDSYDHWSAVVKAWAVGATRSLPDDDRWAIIRRIQQIDEGEMNFRIALEDEQEKA